MKKSFILILFILCAVLSVPSYSFAQQWEWAKGSVNPGRVCESWPITIDGMGNVYEAGSVIQEPGTPDTTMFIWGTDTLLTATEEQVVVVSTDSNGAYRWAVVSEGPNYADVINIVADSSGNVYLYGVYSGTLTLGSLTVSDGLPYSNPAIYFLAKINLAGNVVWLKNVTPQSTVTYNGYYNYNFAGLCIDKRGYPYVAGIFSDFTTSIDSSITLTNVNTSGNGYNDVFLAKYDTSGNAIWAKSFGGDSTETVSYIAASPEGEVYLGGFFYSPSMAFGSDTLRNVSTATPDIYIAKYSAAGTPEWARGAKAGAPPADVITQMAVDNAGNVFVAGGFTDTLKFDSIINLNIGNLNYCNYILKFDTHGNTKWVNSFLNPFLSVTYGVVVDNCENIWTSVSCPTTGGDTDPMVIVEYDSSGTVIDSSRQQTGGDDQNGITLDNKGNVYVSGDYAFASFYAGSDTLYGFPGGTPNEAAFIAKYSYPYMFCTPPPPDTSTVASAVGLININTLEIFPNPAFSELTVSLGNQHISHITISNLLGQTVYNQSFNSGRVEVNVASFPAGIYFIKINGADNYQEIRKFVKE